MAIHDSLHAYAGVAADEIQMLADDTNQLTSLHFATNEHGFAEAQSSAIIDPFDAFIRYDRAGYPDRKIVDNGLVLYQGRVEDISIKGNQITQASIGYISSLLDTKYVALWSSTDVANWFPMTETMFSNNVPHRYAFDTQNRLFLTPIKNTTQSSSLVGRIAFALPHLSSKTIIGVSFDYEFLAPTNWEFGFQTWTAAYPVDGTWTFIATPFSLGATGATLRGSLNLTFSAATGLCFYMYYNAASALYTGENGANYLKITNLRIVTSTTNRINTTLSANRNAGVNVTATVVSTARMYVGQQLQIGNNVSATTSETVTVLSIGSATQFNATFVYNHVTNDTVQAHIIYADEIIKHLITTVNGINPRQLSANTGLIQSPGFDLLDEIYEDQRPLDVIKTLIDKGDNQTTPRLWEFQVWENQTAVFRPRNSASRTWLIDVPLDDFEVQRTLADLYNLTYAIYQDTSGRKLRTTETSDTASQAKYAIIRTSSVETQTTSSTQATIQQNAELADKKEPIPRLSLPIVALFDANGAEWPLYMPRSGDTITIRNLPPALTTEIDRIRSFRIVRTNYDVIENTLEVEPEGFIPSLPRIILMQSRLTV